MQTDNGNDPTRTKLPVADIADRELGDSASETVSHRRLTQFDQNRSLLFGVAYRMLGSSADAEDMVQETFIRWQNTSSVEIQSPKAMLVTIITRLCINHLQSARSTREEYFGEWLPEPIVTTPHNNPLLSFELKESLSLAFLLLLERLTPVERAALLLRDVFDYGYWEIASILDLTEPNCRQLLRRGRQRIREERRRFDATEEQQIELLRRFSEATLKGDMEGLITLLAKEAVFHSDGGGKAPALPNAIYGAGNIARAVIEGVRRLVPTNLVRKVVGINGKPGMVSYLDGRPFSVFSFDVAEGRVSQIYVVTNPQKLKRLPPLTALPA